MKSWLPFVLILMVLGVGVAMASSIIMSQDSPFFRRIASGLATLVGLGILGIIITVIVSSDNMARIRLVQPGSVA